MSKKIIEVDAVERLLVGIMQRGFYNIMGVEYSVDVPVLRNILHRINELATPPPPESQESTSSLNLLSKWIEEQENFEGITALDIQDLKEVVSKITATQQGVDTDDWCHDISKMPIGVEILVSINGNLVKAKFFSSFENIDENTLKSIEKWRLPLNTKGGNHE